MSKTLRTVGMVVAAVALVATGVGALAGAGLLGAGAVGAAGTVAGMSVATITAIGTYAGLAAGVLGAIAGATAPGFSRQGSATTFTTNPQSGLPYAMGRTRMSGLRMYAATSNTPGYTKAQDLLWFGALLSIGGAIGGIEAFSADNEPVTFAANGNAVGRFSNYMAQKTHAGGPQASGIALQLNGGSPPAWTSAHRLSGVTHAMWGLRFDKDGERYGAGAPEPAWIGKWVKVYDPRLDSTYPGGSGACRALQENTYVWSENPGLHALTWALGRWENGKRTCGIGAPIETLRVAEFVECANVCDANGWKVGGVEWTTDSKWDTLKRILQAGGAVPTKTGAMLGCMVSMPRTAIATIESRHLHDGASFPITKSRRDRFNTVIPRYVDEDSDWSVVSGTPVTEPAFAAADGGQRTKGVDFPLVQVAAGEPATQPGQLAAYAIVDSREGGPWTFTTGPEWIGLKTGDVVYLNVPEEGFANQPVLIMRRAMDPTSTKVSFTVQTETYAKHAYALGQTTAPPAPFSLSAPELKPGAPVATSWTVSGATSGEGFPALLVTGISDLPSADAVIIDYRKSGTEPWTSSAILSAIEPVTHVIAPLESGTAYDVRIGYRVGTIDGNFTIFANLVTGVGKVTIIEGGLEVASQEIADAKQAISDALALIGSIPEGSTVAEEIAAIEVVDYGGNLLASSDFANGLAGWSLVTATPAAFSWAVDNSDFTVPGDHYQGLLCLEPNGDRNAAVVSNWIPIPAGAWIQISSWLAARECVARIRMQWGHGGGDFLSEGPQTDDVFHPFRGWENLDGFKRVWCKGQAPADARFVRFVFDKGPYLTNPNGELSWAFMLRPMVSLGSAGMTMPTNYKPAGGGAGLSSARARIEEVSTTAASATGAVASRAANLEAAVGGPDGLMARTATVEGVAANALTRTAAALYQNTVSVDGGRAQMSMYALLQDGTVTTGIDFIGDTFTFSGDVVVDGSFKPRKIDGSLFAREGTSVWSGFVSPGAGQTLNVPFSLTLSPIQPQGRFFYEIRTEIDTNAGQSFTGTFNGKPFITSYVGDGGLSVRSYDDQGNIYVPRDGRNEAVRATTPFGTTFVASVARGTLDTGVVEDGDYYYRQISASYTVTRIDLHVVWIAV